MACRWALLWFQGEALQLPYLTMMFFRGVLFCSVSPHFTGFPVSFWLRSTAASVEHHGSLVNIINDASPFSNDTVDCNCDKQHEEPVAFHFLSVELYRSQCMSTWSPSQYLVEWLTQWMVVKELGSRCGEEVNISSHTILNSTLFMLGKISEWFVFVSGTVQQCSYSSVVLIWDWLVVALFVLWVSLSFCLWFRCIKVAMPLLSSGVWPGKANGIWQLGPEMFEFVYSEFWWTMRVSVGWSASQEERERVDLFFPEHYTATLASASTRYL